MVASLQANSAELTESAAAVVQADDVQMSQSASAVVMADHVGGHDIRCIALVADGVDGDVTCVVKDWWVAAIAGAAVGLGIGAAYALFGRRGRD